MFKKLLAGATALAVVVAYGATISAQAAVTTVTFLNATSATENGAFALDANSNLYPLESMCGSTSATLGATIANCAEINTLGQLQTQAAGLYPGMIAGSTLTRASNTTAYTGQQAVCLLVSVTVCAPMTIALANANAGKITVNRVVLLLSAGSAPPSFNVFFYSAAPTTTSLFDASAYVGPYAADMPNYLGSANCATANATNDGTPQTWYECSLSNPNSAGALVFQALSGSTNVDALVEEVGAWTPASAQTIKLYVGGVY